jgi:hypothetical protein
VYWDGDLRKDLLVGLADGKLRLFLNVATDEDPEFDAGTLLQVGQVGNQIDIDVGSRATPTVVDWNNDGNKDLVVGAASGRVTVFVNEGPDSLPYFRVPQYAMLGDAPLTVPSGRSSPHVMDLDHDGRKDLLAGNSEGQVLFYGNTGTDEDPRFSGYMLVESDGVPIDLEGAPRSRPFVCDWTGDGEPDALIGAADGLVRLYQGVEHATAVAHQEAPPLGGASLLAPYPNPLVSSGVIPLEVSLPGRVSVFVYDVSGSLVTTIAEREFENGLHRLVWLGLDRFGRTVPSGVYFVRMRAAGVTGERKVLLLR